MRKMKALGVMLAMIPFSLMAQYDEPNKELRRVMQNVTPDPADVEFLYDMSMHIAEDKFFVAHSYDTSNTDNFFFMYEEMYYSAYDTTLMERPEDLANRALNYKTDLVPIMIFNYDYLTFNQAALNSADYLTFDTVNDILLNHPSPIGSPFHLNQVFAAATAIDNQYFKTCTFVVDPGFIMYDQRNSYKAGYELWIDFADGNGPIKFDQSITTHHKVTYPVEGDYTLEVFLVPPDGSTPVNTSRFKRRTQTSEETVPPDQTLTIGGINAGIYWACSGSAADPADTKFVILLEGIDLLDFIPALNRDVARIYNEKIAEENLAQLRNFGYSFIVVDWASSRRDMEDNALDVVELIDYLKCTYPNDHEYVLAGSSMGGVIGRYALTYMEQTNYTVNNTTDTDWRLPWVPCQPELFHKTRLYISMDSPHQGANVPLGYQELYKEFTSLILGGKAFSAPLRILLENYFNVGLGSDAAEQLLIYHADHFIPIGSDKAYTQAPARGQFMTDLVTLGNYPQYCKKMALSNGSIYGGSQTRPYDNADRVANDKLFHFDSQVEARILGGLFVIPFYGLDLELRSNPNGNGRVFRAEAGTWGVKIKLKWFGLKVSIGLNSAYSKDIDAVGVNPWCTESGGRISLFQAPGNNAFDNSGAWPDSDFPMFRYSAVNNGNGQYTLDAEVGIPWVAGVGLQADIESDGMGFDFIPVASALDWGNLGNLPLSPDIENEPWPGKMNVTPFDVIQGRHFARQVLTGGVSVNNSSHGAVYNPSITPAIANCPNMDSYILNREIGDEILYLNNRTLPYTARFQAESGIGVNSINPWFSYPSSGTAAFGYYSKALPFTMLANNPVDNHTPMATFISEDSYSYANPQPPSPTQATWIQQTVWICCLGFKNAQQPDETTRLDLYPEWDIYPNPANSNGPLNMTLRSREDQVYVLGISNTEGKVILRREVNAKKGEEHYIDLGNDLPAGLYLVELTDNKSFQQIKKIVIR